MATTNMQNNQFTFLPRRVHIQRGMAFGVIILAALLAFEIFNYSTTDFALRDILGDLRFFGFSWATILAIAFCGIDFAGIARLFTPENGADEPKEVWYLFGAWLLAATMNAMLTWWGVSVAIINHSPTESAVIPHTTILRIVPIFVALLVWLIRVLIIGTFSVAGERLFSQGNQGSPTNRRSYTASPSGNQPASNPIPQRTNGANGANFRPTTRATIQTDNGYTRPEPTYHPVGMKGSSTNNPDLRR